jgi:hypothetical protein
MRFYVAIYLVLCNDGQEDGFDKIVVYVYMLLFILCSVIITGPRTREGRTRHDCGMCFYVTIYLYYDGFCDGGNAQDQEDCLVLEQACP